MWWENGAGWSWWLMMTIAMGGFWVLLALLVMTLVRGDGRERRARHDALSASEVLDLRLARGEIDLEEYRRRLDALSRSDSTLTE